MIVVDVNMVFGVKEEPLIYHIDDIILPSLQQEVEQKPDIKKIFKGFEKKTYPYIQIRRRTMFKKKKYKRQLNNIGKTKYDFDIKDEIKYYNYLSCSYMKDKDKESIDEE